MWCSKTEASVNIRKRTVYWNKMYVINKIILLENKQIYAYTQCYHTDTVLESLPTGKGRGKKTAHFLVLNPPNEHTLAISAWNNTCLFSSKTAHWSHDLKQHYVTFHHYFRYPFNTRIWSDQSPTELRCHIAMGGLCAFWLASFSFTPKTA